MAEDTATATVDTDDKPKGKALDSMKLAQKWATELAQAKKWLSDFSEAGSKCERAYMGPKAGIDLPAGAYAGKTNLFWSNVQVILAAIYGRMPEAEVDRK